VEYVRQKYPRYASYLFAVPNAAKRSYPVMARLRREGFAVGFPDLGILYPMGGYHGLLIEMKRQRGSRGALPRTSPEQTEWVERLSTAGYWAVVCYGAAEALREIDLYFAE